jgi:hypothetical protein
MFKQIEKTVRLQPLGHDTVNNVDLYVGGQRLYIYQNEPEDKLIGVFPLNAQLIQFLAPIGGCNDEEDLPPAAEIA